MLQLNIVSASVAIVTNVSKWASKYLVSINQKFNLRRMNATLVAMVTNVCMCVHFFFLITSIVCII